MDGSKFNSYLLDFVIYNTWIELGEQVVLSVQLLDEMGLTSIYLYFFAKSLQGTYTSKWIVHYTTN